MNEKLRIAVGRIEYEARRVAKAEFELEAAGERLDKARSELFDFLREEGITP